MESKDQDRDAPRAESGAEQDSQHSRFGRLHARTFEMELLLSGAVVFALMHLPSIVASAFTSLKAGLADDLYMLVVFVEGYLGLALDALIGAFVFHLCLRALWIGLVGLESVYPKGILWDRLQLGAFTVARYKKSVGSLSQAVERADDLCSLIFSFAFLIVLTFVYSIAVLVGAVLFAFGLSLLQGGDMAATVIIGAVCGVMFLQLAVGIIDRFLGHYLQPGGLAHGLFEKIVRLAYVLSPMRWTGPTQLTLGSNLSGSRLGVFVILATLLLGTAQIGRTFTGRGLLRFDSMFYFPSHLSGEGLDPVHYRQLRGPSAIEPRYPSIQNDVIAEPYVKLFLPYYPRWHNQLIAAACPDLEALHGDGFSFGIQAPDDEAGVREAATCLGSVFAISLDAVARENLHFDFTVEPGSGLEGVVTFIPVSTLEAGRHEMLVLAPISGPKEDGKPELRRHLIPFWK